MEEVFNTVTCNGKYLVEVQTDNCPSNGKWRRPTNLSVCKRRQPNT